MKTTVAFADSFERADENPLSLTLGGWYSTNLRLLSGAVISTSTSDWGRAVKANTPPVSADQDIRAIVACGSQNELGSVGLTSISGTSPATVTTSTPHGMSGTNQVIFFGVTTATGTTNINGVVYTAIVTGASTFTVAGITAGTYTVASALVYQWKNFVAIAARVTGTADASGYPVQYRTGYVAWLNYEPANVRRLVLFRYVNDGATVDQLIWLTTTTSFTMNQVDSSDRAVGQEIRLTVTTTPDDVVRCRIYLNNDDDDNPTIDYVDRGRDFYTQNGFAFLPPILVAGYWSILLGWDSTGVSGHTGVALSTVSATDNFAVEEENPYAGRTLAQLREAVERTVNRSTATNFSGTTVNAFLNDAQEQLLAELGDLAIFARRTEQMTLYSDSLYRTYMPRHVDKVEHIWDGNGNSRRWWLRDYADDGVLVIQLEQVPGDGGADYVVSYFKRYAPMLTDTDRTIIPRRLDEALVIGAALRVAEHDSDQTWYASLLNRWRMAVHDAKVHMNRQLRMTKGKMYARRVSTNPWTRYAPRDQLSDAGHWW